MIFKENTGFLQNSSTPLKEKHCRWFSLERRITIRRKEEGKEKKKSFVRTSTWSIDLSVAAARRSGSTAAKRRRETSRRWRHRDDDINLPRREVLTHAFLSDVSLGAVQPSFRLSPLVRPYLFRFAARSTISPASDDSPRPMSQTERYIQGAGNRAR